MTAMVIPATYPTKSSDRKLYLPSITSVLINIILISVFGFTSLIILAFYNITPWPTFQISLGFLSFTFSMGWVIYGLVIIPIYIWLISKFRSLFLEILVISSTEIVRYSIIPWMTKKIRWDVVRYIEVEDNTNFLTGIRGGNFRVFIIGLDDQVVLNMRKYRQGANLISFFSIKELEHHEIFSKFYFFPGRGSTWGRLLRDPSGAISMVFISLVIFIYLWAAIAQLFMPIFPLREMNFLGLFHPEYQYAFSQEYGPGYVDRPPGKVFVLGTDFIGRDYFSRLIYGTYFTLNIAVGFAILITLVGTLIGAIAGYFGKTFDQIVTTFSDMSMAIPSFVFWIIGAAFTFSIRKAVGGVYVQILLFYAIFAWAMPARLVRAEVQTLKKMEYIHAEVVYGASGNRILFKHLIPNLIPLVATILMNLIVEALTIVISVSIIIGTESEVIWGSDIARRLIPDFYEQKLNDPYILIVTLFFSIVIFGFILFGDALKDALDPRFIKQKVRGRTIDIIEEKLEAKTTKTKTRHELFVDSVIDEFMANEFSKKKEGRM